MRGAPPAGMKINARPWEPPLLTGVQTKPDNISHDSKTHKRLPTSLYEALHTFNATEPIR